MTSEQFRAMLRRQPFQPFIIRMADGRTFDVPHPEFALLSRSGRTVIVSLPNDDFSVLDLLLMTELQVSNGQSA